MHKDIIHVREMLLPLDDLARSLFLTSDEVIEQFQDARLTGRLAELWGTRFYGYRKHTNSNMAGSDGSIILGPIGRYNIGVRAFRKSLKFQQSKYMGKGRTCTQDDLIHSLEAIENFIAVDLRRFPRVLFYPLDSKPLLRMAYAKQVTPTGMSAERFDQWIAYTFDMSVEQANCREAAA